jgi:hypothetical protein
MLRINQIIFATFFVLIFYSCNGQVDTNVICKKKFKEARDLVYVSPNTIRQSALDSALNLANECLQCDSIKKAVVDFKIALLITTKKYSEGMNFISSLKDDDFTFGYKKNVAYKNFQALAYASTNDTTKQKLVYREIANDLEQYIKQQIINAKEFEEIYIDLFSVKENFLDANEINKEVEILEKKYPDKSTFFEFLKK